MRYALLPALFLIALIAACGGGDSTTPTPSGSPSSSPTASSSPNIVPLTIADTIGFKGDIVVATGCTECDGPDSGIERISTSETGYPQIERLFSAGVHFIVTAAGIQDEEDYHAGDVTFPPYTVQTSKGPQQEKPSITGLAVSHDGQTMAVGLCVAGLCQGDAGSAVAIYRSQDEGATWTEIDRFEDSASVVGAFDDGRVVVNDNYSIILDPGREQLASPQTAGPVYSWFTLPGNEVGWNARGGDVVRSDGTTVVSLNAYVGGPYNLVSLAYSDDRFAASWEGQGDYPGWYLSIFSLDGKLQTTYSVPDGFLVGAWIDSSSLVGTMSWASLANSITPTPPSVTAPVNVPALVDLTRGEILPMTAKGLEAGRNRVLAWLQPTLPTPTPSGTPFIDHSVRACTVDDLVGAFGPTNGMTGGQIVGGLDFGNRSDTACRLEGKPGIELVDPGGDKIEGLSQTDWCFGDPCVVQSVIVAPHTETIEPRHPVAGQAGVALYWPTYDNSAGPPCQSPVAVATVRITLPEGGGTLDVHVGNEPFVPCETLGVGVFTGSQP